MSRAPIDGKKVFEDGDLDWRLALVGQLIGSALRFEAMQKVVDMLWGKVSKVKVSLAGPNLYVFVFSSVDARDWVLENGPWHFQNKPLILRKWEPNMCKLDFDLVCMPMWVQLYNVPLELFNKTGLSYIASALGNPLYMDSVRANRKRFEYAKVCVEIGACSSIPKFIDVLLRDGRVHPVKEVRTTQVWRQKAPVVNDGPFTTCEHGESSLQGTVSVELVVPIVEGVVSSTNVLSAQDVVVQDSSEGVQIETVGAAGQLVCEKRVDVPVDGVVVGIDAEEQVDVPVGGAAMEVDADSDFPTLQL
ncbi:hypothetical protein V6N13_117070 [Hibiscus sabdariffa]